VPTAYQVPLPTTTSSGPPAPPPPPPKPGEVLWTLASGAEPVPPSPGTVSQGSRILVDSGRVVAANGQELFAVSPLGRPLWRDNLQSGLVTLRRWGGGVLVTDSRRMWLYDNGTRTFVADLVAEEEAEGTGIETVQLSDVAVAGELAFVGLGTATIAVNRVGVRQWRIPHPPRSGTGQAPMGGPAAADATKVLIQRVAEDSVQAVLRDAGSSGLIWNVQHGLPDALGGGQQPPPGGGGGGPGGPQNDENWQRKEARLTPDSAVLRMDSRILVLNLASGGLRWQRASATPVVGITVMDRLVLVAADRVVAYDLNTGSERWQQPLRGARTTVTPDGHLALAASENFVTAIDASGAERWQTPIPPEFAGAVVDEVTADDHTVYVTFETRGEPRAPGAPDVLAIALDAAAVRPAA
jgi:outer membrane protein assembly factor BamB